MDYRGVFSKEAYFVAGSIVDDELTEAMKSDLVKEGRAAWVKEPPPKPPPTKRKSDKAKSTASLEDTAVLVKRTRRKRAKK